MKARRARPTRTLLLAALAVALLPTSPLAGVPGPALSATVAAAGWTCPVEDRSTRPNNGGAPVSAFPIKGVDLSAHDTLPLADVTATGLDFAYLKTTQGTYYTDASYTAKRSALRAAAVLVGPYHFFDYRLDGKVQADYFIAAVQARGGFGGGLPPVLDVECVPYGAPDWAASVSRIGAFLAEVARVVGVRPIIYTSIFEWHTVTGGSAAFGAYPLWSAEWAPDDGAPTKFPPGWSDWLFWQWGFLHLDGTTVDADVFHGTAAGLRSLVIPAPKPTATRTAKPTARPSPTPTLKSIPASTPVATPRPTPKPTPMASTTPTLTRAPAPSVAPTPRPAPGARAIAGEPVGGATVVPSVGLEAWVRELAVVLARTLLSFFDAFLA